MKTHRDPSLLIQRSELSTVLLLLGLSADQAKEAYWQLAMLSQQNMRLIGRSRKFNVKAERSKIGSLEYLFSSMKEGTVHSTQARPFFNLDPTATATRAKLLTISATVGMVSYNAKVEDSKDVYKQFVDIAINTYKCRTLAKLLQEKDRIAIALTAKLRRDSLCPEDKQMYYELVNLWVDNNVKRTGLESDDLRRHSNAYSSIAEFMELLDFVKANDASAEIWMQAQFEGLKDMSPTEPIWPPACYTELSVKRYIKYRSSL